MKLNKLIMMVALVLAVSINVAKAEEGKLGKDEVCGIQQRQAERALKKAELAKLDAQVDTRKEAIEEHRNATSAN